MLTAVLDTQIILRGASSVTSSISARIFAAWTAGRFTLVLSEAIFAEIEDVLVRPEVLRKLRMTPVEAAALIELLRRQSTPVTPAVRITRRTVRETATVATNDHVQRLLPPRPLASSLCRYSLTFRL